MKFNLQGGTATTLETFDFEEMEDKSGGSAEGDIVDTPMEVECLVLQACFISLIFKVHPFHSFSRIQNNAPLSIDRMFGRDLRTIESVGVVVTTPHILPYWVDRADTRLLFCSSFHHRPATAHSECTFSPFYCTWTIPQRESTLGISRTGAKRAKFASKRANKTRIHWYWGN